MVLVGLAATLTLVGPFAFVHGFNRVAGTNTYGPVSPAEALGIWPASNYRLNAVGGAHLSGLATAVAALAVILGAVWWLRRRQYAVPAALAACAVLYLAALAASGEYSQAKALIIAAPLATPAMLWLRPACPRRTVRSDTSPTLDFCDATRRRRMAAEVARGRSSGRWCPAPGRPQVAMHFMPDSTGTTIGAGPIKVIPRASN